MFSGKPCWPPWLLVILFSVIFSFLITYDLTESSAVSRQPRFAEIENCLDSFSPMESMFWRDPVLSLLGNNFSEIKELFGEPADEGSSSWHGPHNYISYELNEGTIRFNSPLGLENNLAVSITVSGNHKILCAGIGMTFAEVSEILGEPSFGPAQGMNNLYFMDYFFGSTNYQTPEILISFSAETIDGPTVDAFIKWEAFNYRRDDHDIKNQLYGSKFP